MKADDISRLVKWSESLVYERKGEPLGEAKKAILRQALENRKLEDIHVNDLSDSYVQRGLTQKLWDDLTKATGHKINKRNVSKVLPKILPKIQLQERQDRLVLDEQLCNGQQSSEQVRGRSQTDDPENKGVSDGSSKSTPQKLQLLAGASQPHHCNRSNSNSRGSNHFVKIMIPGVPLLLSFSIYGCLFGMSWLANWYGVINQLAGKLPQAQLGYKIALKLSPLPAATHYNQGSAYEDQQNYERAHAEYQMAIEGGLIPAYNNQARLYILEKKYEAAVALLRVGLPLSRHKNVRTQYSFLKNLGWARLEQGQSEEAKIDLENAIKLEREQAPAHCLLAQLLELQRQQKNALGEWENCLRFNYDRLPEENKWMHIAQDRLEADYEAKHKK